MLIDSLISGKEDTLMEGMDKMIQIPKRKEFKSIKNIESRVFRQRYLLLLNWSLQQKYFEKALQWIPEIEQGLKKYKDKIEKQHVIAFYYLVSFVLFQNKRYDASLEWNIKIVNITKEDVVK